MSITSRNFLDAVQGYITRGDDEKYADRTIKLGTIDPNYISGAPRVIFDGETQATGKGYPYDTNYDPRPGDRVYLFSVGSSYIIGGSLSSTYEYDTGWLTIPTTSPFQHQGTETASIRRIGKVVHMRWGWNNTNMTASAVHNVGVVPAGFRPNVTHYTVLSGNTVANIGRGVVNTGGSVQVITGATLGTYYLFDTSWVLD